MLTKTDFKNLADVLNKEVKGVVFDVVKPLRDDIEALKSRVWSLKGDVGEVKDLVEALDRKVTVLGKGQKKLHKDSGLILDILEKEDRKIKEDIDKIKLRVGMPLVN